MSDSNKENDNEKENGTKESVKQIIENELEKKGSGGTWAWTVFLLCLTPNIFNGFHVNSYVFLATPPENYYCTIPSLSSAGYTNDEIRNISTPKGTSINNTCKIYNYAYESLSTMNYEDAIKLLKNGSSVEEINCLSQQGATYHFDFKSQETSILSEWNLICENTPWASTVQMMLSFGKFIGASSFGLISDKYGRKTAFSIASITYILGSILVTISPTYVVLLLGRLCLGLASSGIFYAAFTLLTENIEPKIRSWMSISFNFSYPLGMLILAVTAYFVRQWRMLSLALTVPAFLLFIHIYFLVESPRWLLSMGRESRAYKMVFGSKMPKALKAQLLVEKSKDPPIIRKKSAEELTFGDKFKRSFSILHALYGPPKLRKRVIICHYTWCMTSLCYYVTALNANIGSDRYTYVAATGTVDILGYLSLIFILRYVGRRYSCSALFFLAGSALLSVLLVPEDQKAITTFLAMLGRYGITSVYAVMTLHTAEMFPTEIRNSALGISSTCAHVGGIAAPYVVDILGKIQKFIPTTICGISVLVAALLVLLQPETKDKHLTDHVDDEEKVEDKEEIELQKHEN